MKKFLGRLCFWGAVIFVVLSVMIGMSYYLITTPTINIPANKNILILGDATTECSIDDNLFKRSMNISQSATHHLFSYCKLKKVLSSTQQIDTVLCAFSSNNIAKEKDVWLFGPAVKGQLIPFMGADEWKVFWDNDKQLMLNLIVQLPKNISIPMFRSVLAHRPAVVDIGAYLFLDRHSLPQELQSRANETTDSVLVCSSIALSHLRKMAELCEQHNVTFCLINCPSYQPEKYGYRKDVAAYHQQYFSDIPFYDYSDFAVPDSCHDKIPLLNYMGAEIFSAYLNEHFGKE
ncbi:MAG: hypothetical protein LBS25_06770 [Candidatus Symbiothrix sp.]|jgi:hypothetical protein|nr:hypothetical protein [Candidatus Symbiothrix sp.]